MDLFHRLSNFIILPFLIGAIMIGCSSNRQSPKLEKLRPSIESIAILEPLLSLSTHGEGGVAPDFEGQILVKRKIRDDLEKMVAKKFNTEVLADLINDTTYLLRRKTIEIFSDLPLVSSLERYTVNDSLIQLLGMFPHNYYLLLNIQGYSPSDEQVELKNSIRSWPGLRDPRQEPGRPKALLQMALLDRERKKILFYKIHREEIPPRQLGMLRHKLHLLLEPLMEG